MLPGSGVTFTLHWDINPEVQEMDRDIIPNMSSL